MILLSFDYKLITLISVLHVFTCLYYYTVTENGSDNDLFLTVILRHDNRLLLYIIYFPVLISRNSYVYTLYSMYHPYNSTANRYF